MAHTPGPWIFSEFCKADGSPIETVDDVADTVSKSARRSTRAQLFGVSLDDADAPDAEGLSTVVCYTGNGPNAHNNARLIAAAPDLLAALKLVVTCYPAAIASLPDDGMERVHAAIAKAEGR